MPDRMLESERIFSYRGILYSQWSVGNYQRMALLISSEFALQARGT